MKKNPIKGFEQLKTVLRFDAGGKGFMTAIYLLLAMALTLLIFGIYFLWTLDDPSQW